MNIDASVPYGRSGWQVVSMETPTRRLNVFWWDGKPAIFYGYEGDLQDPFPARVVSALDSVSQALLAGDSFVPVRNVAPFDGFGFVGGKDRRLLRGIVNDNEALQAFPMYACEVTPESRLPPMGTFRRWTNIFDRSRTPQPLFDFRMKGIRSGLSVQEWRKEKLSTLENYISILSGEADSWAEIRNRFGAVLRLPDRDGWLGALGGVKSHLLSSERPGNP